jgi:hypothetical protein
MSKSGALHCPGLSERACQSHRNVRVQNLQTCPSPYFFRPILQRRSPLSQKRGLVCRAAAPAVGIDFPGLRLGKVAHDRIQVVEGPLLEIRRPDVNIVLQQRQPPVVETELQQLLSHLPGPARSQVGWLPSQLPRSLCLMHLVLY